jgi:hypothetical protein
MRYPDLERIGLKNDIAALIVTGDFVSRGDWRDRVRQAALKNLMLCATR